MLFPATFIDSYLSYLSYGLHAARLSCADWLWLVQTACTRIATVLGDLYQLNHSEALVHCGTKRSYWGENWVRTRSNPPSHCHFLHCAKAVFKRQFCGGFIADWDEQKTGKKGVCTSQGVRLVEVVSARGHVSLRQITISKKWKHANHVFAKQC